MTWPLSSKCPNFPCLSPPRHGGGAPLTSWWWRGDGCFRSFPCPSGHYWSLFQSTALPCLLDSWGMIRLSWALEHCSGTYSPLESLFLSFGPSYKMYPPITSFFQLQESASSASISWYASPFSGVYGLFVSLHPLHILWGPRSLSSGSSVEPTLCATGVLSPPRHVVHGQYEASPWSRGVCQQSIPTASAFIRFSDILKIPFECYYPPLCAPYHSQTEETTRWSMSHLITPLLVCLLSLSEIRIEKARLSCIILSGRIFFTSYSPSSDAIFLPFPWELNGGCGKGRETDYQ